MARGVYKRTRYIEASIPAFRVALEAFNSPTNPYRYENAIILMTNAVELLSKALLLKRGRDINDRSPDRTIPAEKAIKKLFSLKEIEQTEHDTLQQLVSLRNEASHSYLGGIDQELALFLLFAAYKYFQRVIEKDFKSQRVLFKDNYLSISMDQNKTYADSIIGLLKSRKDADRRMLYLLERGVKYDGNNYISQDAFERDFRKNKGKRIENRTAIGGFLDRADMLRIIFVQAPRHYAIDMTLGKSRRKDNKVLPVNVTTRLQCEKNTAEIAEALGIRPYDVQKFVKDNNIKGNSEYHQEVPNGKSPALHRYSEKLIDLIRNKRGK